MRVLLLGLLLACCSPWTQATGIVAVLERSQQLRQDALPALESDDPRAERVRASLAKLLALRPLAQRLQLRLKQGGAYAEAMQGQVLLVGAGVGELSENERLLLLAHELGHLVLGHWQALCQLYLKHIPAEVRPDTTEPVASALSAEAHALSHQQEFEADAYGFALVRQLGVGLDDASALLMRAPTPYDTPTHPATRHRLAQLRALAARLDESASEQRPLVLSGTRGLQ